MDTIKFLIPGKPEYLTMVRLAISSIAATAGFDVEAVDDLKNAVSEACKNVSCHGFEGFSEHYEVDVDVDPGSISITVRDACSEHSLKKVAAPCRQCPQEGDLGVFVIESLVNDVKFSKDPMGHKTITMVKRV
ncbi:MAG: ATP-binding protein [Eubacteriales bacterium]|nr:ATP-binding protein [Eubacteriales bacterium]